MRNLGLLEVERAALIDLVHREITENEIDYRGAREAFMKAASSRSHMGVLDENLDYWIQRLHMLRQLKAKLEREEE